MTAGLRASCALGSKRRNGAAAALTTNRVTESRSGGDGGEARRPYPPEAAAIDVRMHEDRAAALEQIGHPMRQMLPLGMGGIAALQCRELHLNMAALARMARGWGIFLRQIADPG
jgi:hypothetical protein